MAWSVLKASGNDPFPLEGHTSTFSDGQIFVFGGHDLKADKIVSNLAVLNTGGLKSWNEAKQTGVAPSPRQSHSASLIVDKIYYLGGTDGKALVDEVLVFNTSILYFC